MSFLLTASDRYDMVVEAIRETGHEDPIIFESTKKLPANFPFKNFYEPNKNEYLEKVINVIENFNIKYVLCTSGYDIHLETEAELGIYCKENNIGFVGQNNICISICNNKWNTRETLKSLELIPDGNYIESLHELKKVVKSLSRPYIYKPLNEMSGNGQFVILNESDLENLDLQFPGILEHFIEGVEIGVDVFTDGDNHIIFDPVYKSMTSLENLHSLEKIRIAKYPFTHTQVVALRNAAKKVAKAVHSSGWINIDLVLNKDDQIFVLDVNPRTGGTTRINRMASRVNPYSIALESVLRINNSSYENNISFSKCIVEFPIHHEYSVGNRKNFEELFVYYTSSPRSYKGILTIDVEIIKKDKLIQDQVLRYNKNVINQLVELELL